QLAGLRGGADVVLGDADERHVRLLGWVWGGGGRCAGSSGSGAGMRRRRWSGARGVGGGEQGAGAAFEALDLAEGGVLVLDVDVQVRVRRSERREETGPVLHVVPLAERHEAPGRVLRPGGAGVPDPGGGAP